MKNKTKYNLSWTKQKLPNFKDFFLYYWDFSSGNTQNFAVIIGARENTETLNPCDYSRWVIATKIVRSRLHQAIRMCSFVVSTLNSLKPWFKSSPYSWLERMLKAFPGETILLGIELKILIYHIWYIKNKQRKCMPDLKCKFQSNKKCDFRGT